MFEAAAAKVREAGGVLAGGHTIRDPEPKYGLAVIGAAHPDRLFRKGGARPGDVLLLTKRLGTGLLVRGRRSGQTTDADLDAAIDQMRTLNRAASEVLVRHGIRGATDVTGFGLLGHGLEMARARGRGSCSTPRRCRRSTGRWTWRGRAWRPAARVTTGGSRRRRWSWERVSRRSWWRSPTTRRPPAGCWRRSRRRDVAAVMAALAAAGVSAWRVGPVEAGEPGVELR